jgi:arsenate reductase-like glutaredoxin family protein
VTTHLEEGLSSESKETKTEEKAEPVEYDLEVAEDSPISQEELDAIAATAGKYGLSKEEAQKLVETAENKYKAGVSKAETALQEKIKAQVDEIKKDPIFSPDKKDATFASISRAVQKFDDEKGSLAALLKTPEIGNNVVIARLLNKIGEQIAPDTFPGKGGSNVAAPKADETLVAMYPEFFKG